MTDVLPLYFQIKFIDFAVAIGLTILAFPALWLYLLIKRK